MVDIDKDKYDSNGGEREFNFDDTREREFNTWMI